MGLTALRTPPDDQRRLLPRARPPLPPCAVLCCYATVPLVAYAAYVLAAILHLLPCTSMEIVQVDVGGLCSELMHANVLVAVSSPARVSAELAPVTLDVADGASPDEPVMRLRVPGQSIGFGTRLWHLDALLEV
ncbi:hypothetical protein T492DRAFT_864312 [Pavlovales sp. CCMP2436]|nr:hypothetical protein T492DRAFT_864312 [Pavlovales sp. CCMP2436]